MKVTYVFLLIISLIFFWFALSRGLDKTFENQDRMLCESALISGNKEWLERCECYYAGKNIKCLGR